jgi:uncharacterized protein with PIN domain
MAKFVQDHSCSCQKCGTVTSHIKWTAAGPYKKIKAFSFRECPKCKSVGWYHLRKGWLVIEEKEIA